MDKKNTIIGVSLLILGTILMFKTGKQRQQQPPVEELPSQSESIPGEPSTSQPATSQPTSATPATAGHAQIETDGDREDESIFSLENSVAEFRFTNFGGAVKEIVLKEHKKTIDGDEPYVMNHLRYAPALNLSTYLGDAKNIVFSVTYSTEDSISFRAKLSDDLEVVRTYTISQETEGPAPYSISHQLQFINVSDRDLVVADAALNIGTVAPSGSQDRLLQTFGYSNGEDVEFTDQSDFTGGGFLFFSKDPKDFEQVTDTIQWASVKNQFFITIFTPEEPGVGYVARPVDFPSAETDAQPKTGLTGDVKLGTITLPAGSTVEKNFDFYAGPKEHGRISKLRQGQEQAMQFGFFGTISKFLLVIMNWLHGFVGNWGVTIILLTLVVRGALLPITLMSMRSMRKMSKLQEPMKALKEKFPDDTQKQQMMMMELYKLNKINPIAGCLPMILQIPIFFGLFYMLRSAAELRFQDFLWISDLSKPDTIATLPNLPFLGNFPLNVLPFIWVATLAYQMWTMPTPSVDNAQAKLMKFMPFIFFPFTYTFSSGLVLYWTVSNVFTIGQQWLAKRNDPEFEVQLPPALKKALEGGPAKGKRRKKKV